MSFQTTDSKKDEFRKYLEKSGVIDQLTRVLVGLYEEPEKPSNAIECVLDSFIKKYLGAPSDVDVESLRAEHEALKERNAELERQVEELKRELETLRPSEDS